MSTEFEQGDMVYLPDGYRAEYVQRVDSGVLVRVGHSFSDFEGDELEVFEDLRLVERVFRTAPVKRFDAEIEERKAAIVELDEQRKEMRAEIGELQKKHAAVLEKWSRFEALKHIDDFIEDRITHFVINDYGKISVVTKDEALKVPDSNYGREQKLLTLFGGSKGDLQWKLNQYRDGSGSYNKKVWPFTSGKAAHDKAEDLIAGGFDEWRKPVVNGRREYALNYLVGSAEALGIKIPSDIAEKIRSNREASLNDKLKELDEKREKALAELAAVSTA